MSHPPRSIGSVEVRYDEARFTELLLYVADRLRGDRAGGATKLNKVLFFAELTHLRRHHAVISGCEFQKLPHGPRPDRSSRSIGVCSPRVRPSWSRTSSWASQQRLVPRRAADLSAFTEELASIDDVLEQLVGRTGVCQRPEQARPLGARLGTVPNTYSIPYPRRWPR